ncbi:MAG TPA: hypothetical protein VF278_03405 [Pirellulales bacterium]
MKRLPILVAFMFAAAQPSLAAFPGNGMWGVRPTKRTRADAEPLVRNRRAGPPLDIYPAYNPHFDNSMHARGMSPGGGSAYQNNEYSGRGANMSYSYWDGGFNPGSLYSFSMYPHFDRPGFTYWQGGY